MALPVRLRASCAFSHTPLRHGVVARDYCHYGMKTKAAVQIVELFSTPQLVCTVSSDYSRAEDLLNVRDEAARRLSPIPPLSACLLLLLCLLFGIGY